MIDKEHLYLLALHNVKNLGAASAKKLIKILGSAEAVFKEKKQNLLKIDGIGSHKIKDINQTLQLNAAEKELDFVHKNDIQILPFYHPDYPEKLLHCQDGPLLLFQRGNFDLKRRKIISIVGTRNLTIHGKEFCEKLIADLAPLSPVIVSGFAMGADITAHMAAVKNGLQTVACLGHGLNQCYPKSHKKYIKQLEGSGGFLTEFWSDDDFVKTNFLQRNRIIAGLSEVTIVIESAEKGGSLVTADIANSYNREVFAVPGRTTDTMSVGCNNLIKSQQAHLLTSAADLIYLLNWEIEEKPEKQIQKQLFVELTDEEKVLHDYLSQRGKEVIDLIALECNLPTHKAATLLLNLELKGVVRPLPGKMFEVI